MTFDFTVKLSNFLYQWVLDASEGTNPRGSLYTAIFSNDGIKGGHGMEYCFFFLVILSILTSGVFYYVIASNIQNATKKNYVITWIMGYICLVVINYVGMQLVVDVNVLSSFNMVKLCLIDAIYYTAFFEVWSLIMKGYSKAGDIDLLSILKN